MMGRLILTALVALVAGIWASDGLIQAYRLFAGNWPSASCLPDNGICVGDKLSEKRIGGIYTLDKIGGLDAIFCEDINPANMEEELLLVGDIIKGQRCEGKVEGFAFRNSTTRTVVIVEDGVVTEIRRGPLHAIDF